MTTADRDGRVRDLLPMVRKLARRLRRLVPSFDLDDLVGDGSIGLLRAVDSFDPYRGTRLEEYARRLVIGAMLNGIRRMDPVSERSRRIVRDGENARYTLAATSGQVPTMCEMETLCPGYNRALAAAYRGQPLSLDAPLPMGEALVSDWAGDPAHVVAHRAESAWLAALLDGLPPRHRQIVVMHYYRGNSLRSIGRRMAISPQRASQIHASAIEKLKRANGAAPH